MFETILVILNLHHFKRDSYIAGRMSGLRQQWKAEDTVAVTHLAYTLGVKIQESAFRANGFYRLYRIFFVLFLP